MFILKSSANRSSTKPSKCGSSLPPLSSSACSDGESALRRARSAGGRRCRISIQCVARLRDGGRRTASEPFIQRLQHALLNGLDLRLHRLHGVHRPADGAGFLEDGGDLGEDVADLGVRLDDGAAAQVGALPLAVRVVAQLLGLVQQRLHLVFVAAQDLMDRRAHLGALARIVPEDVLEEEQILLADRVAVTQEGVRLQQRRRPGW